MPFVNPLHKKRQRSSSRSQRASPSIYKHARLAEVRYDGSGSNKSTESTSTTLSAKGSVITRRVKRGVASMLSLFGKSDKDFTFDSDESTIVISHNGKHAGFTHGNDSNATTVVKKSSQLVLVGASYDDHGPKDATIPGPPARHSTPNSDMLSRKSSRIDLRRSASTSALYQKLHYKILNTFNNNDATVVVKPDLRSRPSLQALHNEIPEWMQSQMSSSPSTYISSSGSSPKDANKSTPYTSDGLPSTPLSVRRYEGISLVDNEQSLTFNHNTVVSRLSTIPENVNASISIRTVEATAAAKVFFETHFKTVLNELAPRELRKERLEAELYRRGASAALKYEVFQTWYKHETNSLRRARVLSTPAATSSGPSSIAVGDFEIVKVLGKGSFGMVRLVRERSATARKGSLSFANWQSRLNLKDIDTSRRSKRGVHKFKKEVYAMKVIRKSEMLRNGQEGHLRAERDFLVAAEGSKWIIPLLAAFQDHKFLYLVMDFCIGGDFLGLLIRHNVLSEDATKWYVAEMILCIEEAHRMRWIHRDVKPDNFLITADGHLKISDFGLAFDGDWEHDQKFYQQHRSSLIEKLGLEVRGDDDDVAEDNAVVNSRKVADMFPPPGCRSQMEYPAPDEDLGDTPILDHRALTQRRRLARSVVGTSQYMAPEVIRGDMYDGRCD